jgi:vacuolar-type H+-ATPase subunit I/STV1
VQDLRREKLLHLQILNDLIKESATAKRRTKFCAKEIASMNEKKLKVKMLTANIKQKMVRDMEEFSSELEMAKANITNAQTTILSTIREKLQSTTSSVIETSMFDSAGATFGLGSSSPRPKSTVGSSKGNRHETLVREVGHSANEAEALLRETEFGSMEELLIALQVSEESMFALYHDAQGRHEEVEKMELENKHLEQQVESQMKRLHELEGNQEQVKQELEKNIQVLKQSITKYDTEYSRNMDVLRSCSDTLVNLLHNVAVDEAALDQQLLSTGITDRNVDEFLGLIEQRIDELIQMSKAANRQSIRREDFVKLGQADTKVQGFQAPIPPSLLEAGDDDDDSDEMTGKLQPVNIPVLKDTIHKKVQRMVVPTQIRRLDKHALMTNNSRNLSNVSLRSTNSAKSHQHSSYNGGD